LRSRRPRPRSSTISMKRCSRRRSSPKLRDQHALALRSRRRLSGVRPRGRFVEQHSGDYAAVDYERWARAVAHVRDVRGGERSARIPLRADDFGSAWPAVEWFLPTVAMLGGDLFDLSCAGPAASRGLARCRHIRLAAWRFQGDVQQSHQLALQRAVIESSALTQLRQQAVRYVLDRQVRRRVSSGMAPFRNRRTACVDDRDGAAGGFVAGVTRPARRAASSNRRGAGRAGTAHRAARSRSRARAMAAATRLRPGRSGASPSSAVARS
jgi:hypothetical protein